MALAILDLVDFGEEGYDLSVDTGTNTHFELRLGDAVVRRAGASFVDNVFHHTPLLPSEAGGDPLAPPQELRIPPIEAPPGARLYSQLFSYKAGRRSPAFSNVVALPPLPRGAVPRRRPAHAAAQSVESMMAAVADVPRTIPHRSLPARSFSFDTVLGEILRIAQPVVAELLKNPQGPAATAKPGEASAGDIVAGLLRAVLTAAAPPAPTGACAPAPQPLPVSQPKSLNGNRFGSVRYSEPFAFGVDDALIAAAIGPLLQVLPQLANATIGPLIQVLPQLANAANQKDKDRRTAHDALVGGIAKDINQRLLLDKVLEAQRQASIAAANAEGGEAPRIKPEDLAQLAALLARAPAPQPTSETKSLGRAQSRPRTAPTAPAAAPAARAVLAPLLGPSLEWIGGKDPIFARGGRIALRFRFTVGAPAPAKPLPKALLKVTLSDDRNPALRCEKTVKLTGLVAGSVVECVFEPGDLAHLPIGSRLTAIGAVRWPGKAGPIEALGSAKVVLAGPLFVKARRGEVGGERELVDMRRWRPFWNKVWEAPTLQRSEEGKRRWQLDADFRYTVVLGAQDRNGLMETRHRQPKDAPDNDYALTAGRVKAGIEIGLGPLLSLRPLWDLTEPVATEVQQALSGPAFLAQNGGEAQRRIELKGRAGERGQVWIIPTFRLFDVVLSRVTETDATGQAMKTSEETVQMPLPVGVRLLGLRSD